MKISKVCNIFVCKKKILDTTFTPLNFVLDAMGETAVLFCRYVRSTKEGEKTSILFPHSHKMFNVGKICCLILRFMWA